MMHLLEAVVTEGTGQAARLGDSPGRRSAGKTGTTDDYRDAWFVGFTTDIVVGVWVGNDDHSPMDQVAGGGIPAKLWHDFVTEAERILAKPAAVAQRPAPAAQSGSSAPATAAPPPARAALPAAAPPVAAAPPAAAPTPVAAAPPAAAPAPAKQLHGVATVVDSGTIMIDGTLAHLDGVKGAAGEPAHELFRYLAGREIACQPAPAGAPQYRCKIGAYDVSEAVLLNGAARAAADAPARLRDAEEKARAAQRGIWRQ
jgi:hypothetical protein